MQTLTVPRAVTDTPEPSQAAPGAQEAALVLSHPDRALPSKVILRLFDD